MGIFTILLFLPFLFCSYFLARALRRKITNKILFLEFDENTKNLAPRDFFYSIFKMEKTTKPYYYMMGFFVFAMGLFVLVSGYFEYLRELEFSAKYPNFSINPISSVFISIVPAALFFIVLAFMLLLSMYLKNKENTRISKMLDDLADSQLLNDAKEDFFNSDRVIETEIQMFSNIKLGDRYLFSIYFAYIIPYSQIENISLKKMPSLFGYYHYLEIIAKNSLHPVQIVFNKKEEAEKTIDFILTKSMSTSF